MPTLLADLPDGADATVSRVSQLEPEVDEQHLRRLGELGGSS